MFRHVSLFVFLLVVPGSSAAPFSCWFLPLFRSLGAFLLLVVFCCLVEHARRKIGNFFGRLRFSSKTGTVTKPWHIGSSFPRICAAVSNSWQTHWLTKSQAYLRGLTTSSVDLLVRLHDVVIIDENWWTKQYATLRITGLRHILVWMCIVGVWNLQTTSFEIPWF